MDSTSCRGWEVTRLSWVAASSAGISSCLHTSRGIWGCTNCTPSGSTLHLSLVITPDFWNLEVRKGKYSLNSGERVDWLNRST